MNLGEIVVHSSISKITGYLRKPIVLFFVAVIFIPINYSFFTSQQFSSTAIADPMDGGDSLDDVRQLKSISGNNIKITKNTESAVQHAVKHTNPKFICPMHADIISEDSEATCPICGMDLVILEETGEAGIVQISQEIIDTMGVNTALVKRKTIYRKIESVGYVTYDENRIRRVSLRTEAWIEKLYVKSVGEKIERGDLLFQVYSPNLINAQEEYLQTLKINGNNRRMLSASKKRLNTLGISRVQIERLTVTGEVEQLVDVYASQKGVVIELKYREGAFVPPSKSVVSLADLSSVWLMADIFESQIDWVKIGNKVEASLTFLPGKRLLGSVEYIYPSVDQKTRSVKARLRFDNSDGWLKPNMYASITIYAKPSIDVLTIPREAVIRTGSQNRVIVALEGGRFKPAIVQTGIETDSKVEITNGLDEGQSVVVSSQFLIDSESSIRAAILKVAGG